MLPFHCLCRMFLFSGRTKCFWLSSPTSKYSFLKAMYIHIYAWNPTVAQIILFNSQNKIWTETQIHFYTLFKLRYRSSNTTLGWIFQVVLFPRPAITEEIVNFRQWTLKPISLATGKTSIALPQWLSWQLPELFCYLSAQNIMEACWEGAGAWEPNRRWRCGCAIWSAEI